MKKLLLLFYLLIFLLPYLFISSPARAIEKAQAEDVSVTAQVPSPVSAENSSVKLNTQETLADPVNHPILLTVYLLDSNQKPLAGREVAIISNRGSIDIIEAASKISQYQIHAAEVSAMQKDKTNKEGKVSFRVTSFVPGKTTLQVMADNVVPLETQTIQFKPLPFPANLTISVAVPFSQKEWTIFSPRLQEENLSTLQKEAKTLANSGTKIKLNFWAFVLLLLIVIGMPIFLVLNFINLRKIRLMENEQSLLLKKMFPPNFNRQS